MPLTMVSLGEMNSIKAIRGKDENRKFLESLGFVVGGNVIVNVKETRVEIDKAMANKIIV